MVRKKSGWYNESRRHSLASKGVKTKTKKDEAMMKSQTQKTEMKQKFERCVLAVDEMQKEIDPAQIPPRFRKMPPKSRAYAICTAKLGYQVRNNKIIPQKENRMQTAMETILEADDFFLDKVQGMKPQNILFNPELDRKIEGKE